MIRIKAFLFRPFFLFLLLLVLLFLYFKDGSLTTIGFKYDKVIDGVEVFVDNNKIGSFSFENISKGNISISVNFFETFTPREIKQKTSRFYLSDDSKINYSQDAFLFNSVSELRGKTVGVEIKNLEQAGVHINFGDNEKYSIYLRPLRENDWSLAKTINGKEMFLKVSNRVPVSAWQQFRKIGMIVTEPFPYLVVFIFFIYMTKGKKNIFTLSKSTRKTNTKIISAFVVFGVLLPFFWFFYLNQRFIEGIPHVGDAVTYMLQAKFLADGKICGVPKIPIELFDFFKGWGPLLFDDRRWCGYYPFGHPLMLAIGVLIGTPGIIPPLLASLSLVFIFLIGKKVGNWKIGFFAWLITFVSPFFQMNAASFMSHNTAVFYETVGFYFLIAAVMDKKKLYFFVSGFSLGLLFNTRPFTVVGLVIPILTYLLLSKVKFSSVFIFCVSCLIFSSLYFLYNYLSFGTLFETPYLQKNLFLFDKGETPLTNYLLLTQTHLITFLTTFHGWQFVISMFLFLFSVLVKKTKEIILFFLSTVGIALVWGFSDGGTYAITYGPRYWFEIIPFVSLLFSFSIYYFSKLFKNKFWGVITYCFFMCLILYTTFGWLEGNPVLWKNIAFTPVNISELKGFNYTDAKLIKKSKELKITNAIIFVKDCGGNWWCYGSVLPQNNPKLDSDIVWVSDLGIRNQELKNYYRGRKFYIADYYSGEIIPY